MISHDPASQKLAIGLAMLAGFVDALGYLSLGGVFISFMSGNSTRLAVGLSDGTPLIIALIPLGIIVLFVLGVMAGRVIRHIRRDNPSTSILAFMCTVLACSALLHELGATTVALILMTIAMGAANNVFFRGGEVSVGVTYMTGTLVKFGQRLAGKFLGEKDSACLPYLLLWTGLVTGAILGSIGYGFFTLHALWAATALCALLAMVSMRIEGRKETEKQRIT